MEIRFDWPRIHESVLFESSRGEKTAQVAAREIERLIERNHTTRGELVGTSPELCERFGIGRETLLEAIRLLEDRGVARMRRGRHGGLFSLGKLAVDPAETVRRYLLGARITVDQAREARSVIALLNIYDQHVRCGRDAEFDGQLSGILGSGQPIHHLPVSSRGSINPPPNHCLRPFVDALDRILAVKLQRDVDGNGEDGREASLVGFAAEYLAGEVLRVRQLGVGKLGCETHVAERIGVSRQVLRQAVRLLEDQGLLVCRRGRSNGIAVARAHPPGILRFLSDAYARSEVIDSEFHHILAMLGRINRTLFAAKADHTSFASLEHAIEQIDWTNPVTHMRRMHIEWPVINNPALSLLEQALSGYRARRAGTQVFVAISDVGELRRRTLEHVDLMRAKNFVGADHLHVEMLSKIAVLLDGR